MINIHNAVNINSFSPSVAYDIGGVSGGSVITTVAYASRMVAGLVNQTEIRLYLPFSD